MSNTIIPQVKSLFSSDLPEGELPADPEDCCIFIEAEIGSMNSDGADIFSFFAVTRQYLAHEKGTRWGHGLLLLDRFSWEVVQSSLEKLLMHCYFPTWREVAYELGKRLNWEFDNYTP